MVLRSGKLPCAKAFQVFVSPWRLIGWAACSLVTTSCFILAWLLIGGLAFWIPSLGLNPSNGKMLPCLMCVANEEGTTTEINLQAVHGL